MPSKQFGERESGPQIVKIEGQNQALPSKVYS
jgi:hypothetical protein